MSDINCVCTKSVLYCEVGRALAGVVESDSLSRKEIIRALRFSIHNSLINFCRSKSCQSGKLLEQCIVDGEPWFTNRCFRLRVAQHILEVLEAEASLYIHRIEIFISINIRIACTLLQESIASEGLSNVTFILKSFQRLFQLCPILPNSRLMPGIATVLEEQLNISRSYSKNTAACRVFVVFCCLKVVLDSRSRRDYEFVKLLCRLLEKASRFQSGHKQCASQKVLSTHGRKILLEFRITRATMSNNKGNTGNARESSFTSLRCSLDKGLGYTLSDHALEHNESAHLVTNMHIQNPSEYIKELAIIQGESNDWKWVTSEYSSWTDVLSMQSSVANACWQRVLIWCIKDVQFRVALQKHIIHSMEKCLRLLGAGRGPAIDVAVLKSVWLLALQPSPEVFIQKLLKSASEIVTTSVHNCLGIFTACVHEEERERADFAEISLKMLLAACNVLTSFSSHVESDHPMVVISPLLVLVDALLDAKSSCEEDSGCDMIDGQEADMDSKSSNWTCVMSILANHLGYLLLHGHDTIAVHIESMFSGNPLRSVLMLVFDSHREKDLKNEGGKEVGEPSDCVLSYMNPVLAAYLHVFVLPSLAIPVQCKDNTCIKKESLFTNRDLVQLDLTTVCSPYAPLTSILSGQVHQWKPMVYLHTRIPNFHQAISMSPSECALFVSHLMNAAVETQEEVRDRKHVNKRNSPGSHARSTPAHRALITYDVIILIMSFLSVKRLCRLICVNKTLSDAGHCDQLWHQKYLLRWPIKFHNYRGVDEIVESPCKCMLYDSFFSSLITLKQLLSNAIVWTIFQKQKPILNVGQSLNLADKNLPIIVGIIYTRFSHHKTT